MQTIDQTFIRQSFPSLRGGSIFLDNAGGSQVVAPVAQRISDYLLGETVQLGASYEASQKAGEAVASGREALSLLMNAVRPEEVVMGATATQLFEQLASSLVQKWQPGDEVIVTNFDHEANIGPWRRLEAQGIVIREWQMPEGAHLPDINDLHALLNEKTRLVAVTHVSNIYGSIMPVREIADAAHAAGALICVDGVAYAPHRAIDVQALGADFYGFSAYKVYGPHHAALYGRYELLRDQAGNINHYFYGDDKVPQKLEPGNPNYELSYGCLGIVDYLEKFAQSHGTGQSGRIAIEAAFDIFAQHEEMLSRQLLSYLNDREDVTIIGTTSAAQTARVPTVSFVVHDQSSEALVRLVDPAGIGIRFGDFHSKRLVNSLGLSNGDGVIRVSAVHYNTEADIDRLIEQLERLR